MSSLKAEDKNPYLSIIINSRNDNYQGGGFIRMQAAINNLVNQAKKYHLRAELIIVDWNPPQDKPLLKEALSLPSDLGPLTVRFIVVPHSIHEKYHASVRLNLIWAAAMNVGIRRARGEFILPTNSDILLSDELVQFLASEKLKKDLFYRAIRYELPKDILTHPLLSVEVENFSKGISMPDLSHQISPHGLASHPVLMTFCGTDFIVFVKEHWHLMHGYPELNNLGITADELVCYMAYLSGLKEEILKDSMRIYHLNHDSRWHTLGQSRMYRFVNTHIFQKFKPDHAFRASVRKIYRYKENVSKFFLGIYFTIFNGLIKKYVSSEKLDWDVKYMNWYYRKVLGEMLLGKRPYQYNDDN